MSEGTMKPDPDPTVMTTEQLERAIAGMKELMFAELRGMTAIFDERFQSIGTQLALIERQRIEQKQDTKAAVDAALAAAKEAVKEQTLSSEKSINKSETATSEQLKQLLTTVNVANEGLKSQADDLKERVGKIEAVKQGSGDAFRGLASIIAVVGTLLGIIIVLASTGVFTQ